MKKNNLYIRVLSVFFLFLCFFGFLTYHFSRTVLIETEEQRQKLILDTSFAHIEDKVTINARWFKFLATASYVERLAKSDNSQESTEEAQSRLMSIRNFFPSIVDLEVKNIYGKTIFQTCDESQRDYTHTSSPVLDGTLFTSVRDNQNGQNFVYMSAIIYSHESKRALGSLGFFISFEAFLQRINAQTQTKSYVISSEFMPLFLSEKDREEVKALDFRSIIRKPHGRIAFLDSVKDKAFFVRYMPSTDWYIVSVVSEEVLSKPLERLNNYFALAFVASLFLAALFAYAIVRHINNNFVKDIEEDEFECFEGIKANEFAADEFEVEACEAQESLPKEGEADEPQVGHKDFVPEENEEKKEEQVEILPKESKEPVSPKEALKPEKAVESPAEEPAEKTVQAEAMQVEAAPTLEKEPSDGFEGLTEKALELVDKDFEEKTAKSANKQSVEKIDEKDLSEGASSSGLPLHGMHVLVAEDNEINQLIIQDILEQFGCVVHLANNGAEAVLFVEEKHVDIILMDIQMPVMDGLTAARSLQKNPECKDIPIVAMTAHALESDKEESREAGMCDHVTKPVDPEHLLAVLQKCLEKEE